MHLLYDSSLTKNIALDSTIVNTPFNYFLFFLARTTLWITRNRQSIAAIVMPVHHAWIQSGGGNNILNRTEGEYTEECSNDVSDTAGQECSTNNG